tara:strand:- start:92 stop:1483 length:1392 start_codon:yes stop_codon:yes gene_type:complete
MLKQYLFFLYVIIFLPFKANAHVSERALVLLLPTEIYIPAGISVLIITILLTYFKPVLSNNFFKKKLLFSIDLNQKLIKSTQSIISIISLIFLFILLYIGWTGSRDPLGNPLPLFIWTIWFVLFPVLIIIFGNIWKFLNPWIGICRILNINSGFINLNKNLNYIPAIFGFICFALFMLVYLAPNDPDILANVVFIYWMISFLLIIIFGETWLEKGECFSLFFNYISKISLVWIENNKVFIGFFGFRLTQISFLPITFAFFISTILATLTFDGLNETFWWFNFINVNPLEFYGRSSVVLENSLGLIGFVILLFFFFSLMVFLGLLIIKKHNETFKVIGIQSVSLLPIAMGYHIAHYLTSFIVDIQYVITSLTDPFNNGSDIFGLGLIYQTTGFFNSIDSVNLIWICQGSAIVIGHMLAVLISHSISHQYLHKKNFILISQIPISIFMVCYTFLGLWILSSPIAA